MPKARTSSGYRIVGKTSDGVTILKPKMSSGRLREMRAKVEEAMAASRKPKASAPAKAKPIRKVGAQ